MFDSGETARSEGGVSARHLVFIFLACVAVCAVFFSLGYLVGFNERASKPMMATENVSTPAAVPPMVNPPSASPGSNAASEPQTAGNSPNIASAPATAEKPEPLLTSKTPAPPQARPTGSVRPATGNVLARQTGKPPRPPGGAGAGYSVQVMASRTRADAESLAKLLRGRGYPAFVLSARAINAKDHLFRVLVGPYTTRDRAETYLKKLEKEGFQPFIKH